MLIKWHLFAFVSTLFPCIYIPYNWLMLIFSRYCMGARAREREMGDNIEMIGPGNTAISSSIMCIKSHALRRSHHHRRCRWSFLIESQVTFFNCISFAWAYHMFFELDWVQVEKPKSDHGNFRWKKKRNNFSCWTFILFPFLTERMCVCVCLKLSNFSRASFN